MIAREEWLLVGRILRAHGLEGEAFVRPFSDYPDRFAVGSILRLGDDHGVSLLIEAIRPHKDGYLIRFEGIADRTMVEHLAGRELVISLEEAEPLEEGEFFLHELIGLRVETVNGESVGEVSEVITHGPHDYLVVRGPRADHLIPMIDAIVRTLDPEEGLAVIDPPDGLLDLGG